MATWASKNEIYQNPQENNSRIEESKEIQCVKLIYEKSQRGKRWK